MRNNFDSAITKETDSVNVDYAFVAGNSTCVFIKVGLDGSSYGYENKYLTIAERLNTLYGYSVVVSSNPEGSGKTIEEGYNITLSYMNILGYNNPQLYYMGFSNGAYRGFVEASDLPFEKYLLINSPLMINYHKISKGLKAIGTRKALIVYSEKDPSIKYSQMLTPMLGENIKLEIVPGADHQFVDMLDAFIDIPIQFFK